MCHWHCVIPCEGICAERWVAGMMDPLVEFWTGWTAFQICSDSDTDKFYSSNEAVQSSKKVHATFNSIQYLFIISWEKFFCGIRNDNLIKYNYSHTCWCRGYVQYMWHKKQTDFDHSPTSIFMLHFHHNVHHNTKICTCNSWHVNKTKQKTNEQTN